MSPVGPSVLTDTQAAIWRAGLEVGRDEIRGYLRFLCDEADDGLSSHPSVPVADLRRLLGGMCIALGRGLDGEALACDRLRGHEGTHHDASGAEWAMRCDLDSSCEFPRHDPASHPCGKRVPQ